jgi:predicted metal-binding membrane protein
MGLALLPFLGLWVVMMAAMMLPFRAGRRVIDAVVIRRATAARLPAAS